MTNFKSRESTLRRKAERRGLSLHRSHRRDPLAVGYGQYILTNASTGAVVAGTSGFTQPFTLDDVAAYLDAMEPAQ